MKVTTAKASPALLGFLGKGAKSQEIPWPSEETPNDSSPVLACDLAPAETTPLAPEPVSPIAERIEATANFATAPAILVEIPSPAVEIAPEVPTVDEAIVPAMGSNGAPATAEETPIVETSSVEILPQAPIEEPAVEIAPAPARKPPTLRDLLESDEWIRNLCTELIESEKRLLEEGAQRAIRSTNTTKDPLTAMWTRFRQNGNREKFLAEVEKESRRISGRNLETEIPRDRLVELKQTFLKAIRHIQEPYRSTLFRHFCEGLSIAEMIGRQEVSGWIVRQRLVAGLDLLDRTLEEMLGKERIRNYVLLSKVGVN